MKITERKQASNAIKWIKALLSGKYKQQKGILGNVENGFCCWGLGCYIVRMPYTPKNGWDKEFAYYVGYNNINGDIKRQFYGANNLGYINDKTKAGFIRIGKMLISRAEENFNPYVAKSIKKHFSKN